jgi:DNA-binding MarR family transcriptional regulator
MFHVMRTIPSPERADATRATAADATADGVMASFAEFRRALGELRCAAQQGVLRSGISMTQIHVLTLLEHHGDLPMSRLADMLGVSFSNATGLIDRMEENGFVERVRSAEDRRVVHVRPATRGREALHEVQLVRDDMMHRLLERLAPDQLARIAAAMADLHTAIEAEAAEAFGGRAHDHTRKGPC